MIGDLQLGTMWLHMRGILCVFTALTLRSGITQAVPAPFNVSVTCDSYGVVVEWMASGLSQQADFLLELQPNFGENMSAITKYPRYNVSSLMLDTEYNLYVVRVAARDGENQSGFAFSQKFSYNSLDPLNTVICDLEFPPVTLLPRDGKLFVKFPNPVHLYNGTPALRTLRSTKSLDYSLTSSVADKQIEKENTCSDESDTCESSLEFPEELEEYCVTLVGKIRKMRVRESGPHCYRGTLNPGPPISTILIPLLVGLAVFVTLSLLTALLVELLIKRQGEKIFPEFLKDKNETQLIRLLKPPLERVDENPSVEPVVVNSLDMICKEEESTPLPETSACSSIAENYTESKNMYKTSGSSEASGYAEGLNEYRDGDLGIDGDEEEQAGSSLSTGYDRPHV